MANETDDKDGRVFKVRPDAFFVRHADGVWLRNDLGSFSVRGEKAYDLVEKLFANLDGQRRLEDICGGLPENARQSVLRLVETLWRNGFIKEVTHPPELTPAWMSERYAAHLAFLEHHADRPVARMTRVRSSVVTCAGSGVALRALLGALRDFGIARVRVLTTPSELRDGVAELITEAGQADPHFEWEATSVPESAAGAALLPEPSELAESTHLLLATDDTDTGDVGAAQSRLREHGIALGVLGRCGEFVVAAPAHPDWCWECVRRSIAGTPTGDSAGLPPAVAPATVAALHLVQGVFATLADVPLEGADRVTTVEPLAPVVRTHAMRRHPRCPAHGPIEPETARANDPIRPDVPAAEDPPELVAVSDRIVQATARWTDPVTGPLLALGEGEHDQLPLATSACRVAHPSGTAEEPRTAEFACRAISPREARNQVTLLALEWLASEVSGCRLVGAGWSVAEARYRAHLAASHALPIGTLSTAEASADTDVLAFLNETLAATGRAWKETAVETLSTGFVRASVRTGDGQLSRGIGIDRRHATANALLRAVAAELERSAALAHLAPPVGTWSDALQAVSGAGTERDITGALPFVGDDAHLVAITEEPV